MKRLKVPPAINQLRYTADSNDSKIYFFSRNFFPRICWIVFYSGLDFAEDIFPFLLEIGIVKIFWDGDFL